jgi:hypothetical protein
MNAYAGNNDGEPLAVLHATMDASAGTINLYVKTASNTYTGSATNTDYTPHTLLDDDTAPTLSGLACCGNIAGIDGVIGEVIVYNSVLSSTDRAAVETYLYNKYIPEPATIALLGLGGLALIRKRR